MTKFIVLDTVDIDISGLTPGECEAVEDLCDDNRPDLLYRAISNDRIHTFGIEQFPALMCLDDETSCPTHKTYYTDGVTLRHTKMAVVEKLSDYLDPSSPPDRNTARIKDIKPKTLPNYERDKRLYELACDKKNYPSRGDVAATINKEFPDEDMGEDGVMEAAKRYAVRNNLPMPPERKRGRPRSN